MFVTSSAIQNGAFEDKYGKRGTQFSPNGMPTYSIPFEIHDAPQGTKSFAVVLEDKDALRQVALCGFIGLLRILNVPLSKKMKAKLQQIMYKVQILGRVN